MSAEFASEIIIEELS